MTAGALKSILFLYISSSLLVAVLILPGGSRAVPMDVEKVVETNTIQLYMPPGEASALAEKGGEGTGSKSGTMAESVVSVGKSMVFFPEVVEPGGFILVEAGPFQTAPEPSTIEIDFDFLGSAGVIYYSCGMVYTLLTVSADTKPGLYRIALSMAESDKAEVIANPGQSIILESEITVSAKEFSLSRFSMPAGTTDGWTAARLAEDREKVRLAREPKEPCPLWQKEFVLPLEGRISSPFGAIRIINNNPPRRHQGVDIAAPTGEPVYAANCGTVELAEFLLSGGETVIINHGMGLSSTYMHLDQIKVSAGNSVERGDIVGTVGMTGYATGPHLHWEVNIGQRAVDPHQLLQGDLLWVAPAYAESFRHTLY